MIKHLSLKAYGKINLGLDVLRRREDGYHDVRMIMQTVGIFDRVDLVRKEEPGIEVETNLYYLPTNENNLVYKAAKLLMDEFQVQEGLLVRLRKFIPVAAGMAGGSSDAAAVLFGVNKMFRLGLTTEELMERGVKIGADVPYCILRGTALSEGIGRNGLPDLCFKITHLPVYRSFHFQVFKTFSYAAEAASHRFHLTAVCRRQPVRICRFCRPFWHR